VRVEGVFCRDCALAGGGYENAAPAVDAVDLPDAVKDDRWVWHRIACPHCRASLFAPAGPANCEQCDRRFVVGSCEGCGAVEVFKTEKDAIAVTLPQCRNCGWTSPAPAPVRNWSVMLIGQAIAEIAADVLKPENSVSPGERRLLAETFADFPEFSPEAVKTLKGHFEDRLRGKSSDALSGCLTHCKRQFRKMLLGIAVALAEADGPIRGARWQAIRRLASKLGLDPEIELRGKRPLEDAPALVGAETCWAILQITPRTSMGDVKRAYRRQASQHHPDRQYGASPDVQAAAEARMKTINAAFADALAAVSRTASNDSSEPQTTPAPEQRQAKKRFASKWIAVSARPPYAVSSVTMSQKSPWFTRRTVLRFAGLLLVAVITRFVLGLVMTSNPNHANDLILIAFPAGSVAMMAALIWGGLRAAIYMGVVLAFAGLAVLWYQGLTKAIEYEQKHARELHQLESSPR
jgi:DnaJ-domain-containing protein 1